MLIKVDNKWRYIDEQIRAENKSWFLATIRKIKIEKICLKLKT